MILQRAFGGWCSRIFAGWIFTLRTRQQYQFK